MLALLARFVAVRAAGAPRTRAAVERAQRRALARWERRVLPRAPHGRAPGGRPLRHADLPVVDKATVLARFASFTTTGTTLEEAMAVARRAERSRDFAPTLPGGIAVGLSSGTSGTPGVFLVSERERQRWAGEILARVLSRAHVRRILAPWRPPLRIGFLLRADSQLYRSVASRRVRFAFFDLVRPIDEHLGPLERLRPDVLVGPATALRAIADAVADGRCRLAPAQVVSVAEVLEPRDAAAIEAALGARPQQVYQATEGLLGTSCAHGSVHLREQSILVERERLPGSDRAFVPIVTDLERETQIVARYRLDDVLVERAGACPCGDARLALEAIGGRLDESLALRRVDGGEVRALPDAVRRAFAVASEAGAWADWAIEQDPLGLVVRLREPTAGAEDAVREALEALAAAHGAEAPPLRLAPWRPQAPGAKLRRIRRVGEREAAR